MLSFIDAHVQVAAAPGGRGTAPPAPAADPLRDPALRDLAPLLDACNVGGVVLVQHEPTAAATQHVLDVARRHEGLVRGVVAWADLAAHDAIPMLARLAREPLLKAVRLPVTDLPACEFAERNDVARTLAALPRLGLRLDVKVDLAHLPAVRGLLDRHVDLAIVLDPIVGTTAMDAAHAPWLTHLRALAAHPRLRCKAAGLAAHAGWTIETVRPWLDALVECVGPQRLLWGSHWPAVNGYATYKSWYAASVALTAGWPAADRDALMGGTARRCYGL